MSTPLKNPEPSTASEDSAINERHESVTDVVFQGVVDNHVTFTFIADHKAYVMIYVNSIIIGALTTILLPQLAGHPSLTVPTILMLVTCFVSLSYSILAIRPQLGSGVTSSESLHKKQSNLFYFGNFHRMPLPDFEKAMKETLRDETHLLQSRIRDIYFLGRGLGVKYKQVRTSYNIFLIGMLISVLVFIGAVLVDLSLSQSAAGS